MPRVGGGPRWMGRWSPEASWRAARPEPRRVRQGTLCAAPWAALPPAGSLAQPKITGELSAGEGEGGVEGGGMDPPGRTPRPTSGPSSAPGFFWGTAFSPLTAPFCVVAAELQELGGLGLGRPGGADGLRVGGWRGLWSGGRGGGIGSSEELSACPSLLNATPYTDPTPTGEQMLEGLRG